MDSLAIAIIALAWVAALLLSTLLNALLHRIALRERRRSDELFYLEREQRITAAKRRRKQRRSKR